MFIYSPAAFPRICQITSNTTDRTSVRHVTVLHALYLTAADDLESGSRVFGLTAFDTVCNQIYHTESNEVWNTPFVFDATRPFF